MQSSCAAGPELIREFLAGLARTRPELLEEALERERRPRRRMGYEAPADKRLKAEDVAPEGEASQPGATLSDSRPAVVHVTSGEADLATCLLLSVKLTLRLTRSASPPSASHIASGNAMCTTS